MSFNTYTVERVVSGTIRDFDTEVVANEVNIREAMVAYFEAMHTGHPTWMVNNSTGLRVTKDQLNNAMNNLLIKEMVV